MTVTPGAVPVHALHEQEAALTAWLASVADRRAADAPVAG